MSLTVFTNAFLIDCTGADPVEGAAVVVEDDRIQDVIASGRVGPRFRSRPQCISMKLGTLASTMEVQCAPPSLKPRSVPESLSISWIDRRTHSSPREKTDTGSPPR